MIDVVEKPQKVEKALLVGVEYPGDDPQETDRLLEELKELVETLNIGVVHMEHVKIREPKARHLLGSGRTEEIIALAKDLGCDCIIFDNELTPGQQRNWERDAGMLVIDRQEVILDIFAERAQTKEAVLQVELARMEYNLPRLKRAWTHLDRQRGGGAVQRGEGEAQIELDARMVRSRIAQVKRQLEGVVRQRGEQRKQRRKVPVPTASIVGYTNAGKSSLLNHVTKATVLAEDKLFATLDPTTRRLQLPQGHTLLLTDTVGFVRRLPHRLVEAFKATLEEALLAEFLVHVLDANSPDVEKHRETTLEVLKELGADEKRIITVYNKADLMDAEAREQKRRELRDDECLVSAKTGEGMDQLLELMEDMLAGDVEPVQVLIPYSRHDMVSRFHDRAFVKEEDSRDEGTYLRGNLKKRFLGEFEEYLLNGKDRSDGKGGEEW